MPKKPSSNKKNKPILKDLFNILTPKNQKKKDQSQRAKVPDPEKDKQQVPAKTEGGIPQGKVSVRVEDWKKITQELSKQTGKICSVLLDTSVNKKKNLITGEDSSEKEVLPPHDELRSEAVDCRPGHDRNWTLGLMSDLKGDNNNAQINKIYLSDEGKYVIKDSNGKIHTEECNLFLMTEKIIANPDSAQEGELYLSENGDYVSRFEGKIYIGNVLSKEADDDDEEIDLSDLEDLAGKISDKEFKSKILKMTSRQGHSSTGELTWIEGRNKAIFVDPGSLYGTPDRWQDNLNDSGFRKQVLRSTYPFRAKPFNEAAMRKIIANQLDTLIQDGERTVVLSAFWCEVLLNPPEEVARIYREELRNPKRLGKFDYVVFPIDQNENVNVDNFKPFKEALEGVRLKAGELEEYYKEKKLDSSWMGRYLNELKESIEEKYPSKVVVNRLWFPSGVAQMKDEIFNKNNSMTDFEKIEKLREIAQERLDNPPRYTHRKKKTKDLYKSILEETNESEENALQVQQAQQAQVELKARQEAEKARQKKEKNTLKNDGVNPEKKISRALTEAKKSFEALEKKINEYVHNKNKVLFFNPAEPKGVCQMKAVVAKKSCDLMLMPKENLHLAKEGKLYVRKYQGEIKCIEYSSLFKGKRYFGFVSREECNQSNINLDSLTEEAMLEEDFKAKILAITSSRGHTLDPTKEMESMEYLEKMGQLIKIAEDSMRQSSILTPLDNQTKELYNFVLTYQKQFELLKKDVPENRNNLTPTPKFKK